MCFQFNFYLSASFHAIRKEQLHIEKAKREKHLHNYFAYERKLMLNIKRQ